MKTLPELQKEIKDFCEKNDLISSPEHCALDMVSEIGEVAKEILKMTEYGGKPLQKKDDIKNELGDVLYSLVTVANALDVDLEEALNIVLDKYRKRLQKGGASSEND